MTERKDRDEQAAYWTRLIEAHHRRCTSLVEAWPKWMQDVTLTKYSVRPAPKPRDAAAMAEGGEHV